MLTSPNSKTISSTLVTGHRRGFQGLPDYAPTTIRERKVINFQPKFDVIAELNFTKGKLALAEKAQAIAENTALKADASNKAKSDFLANMTHEIRTPLGAIMGLASILQTTNLDDKQKQCLAVLQNSAEDLMTMINGSLDIDKIESNIINLEQAPLNMPALLRHLISVMSVKAQEKGIGLSLQYEADLPKIFVGDSGRIRQIVMNLVGNAIKFTETGKVIIAFACGGNIDGKEQISISVTDTGIGIPEDKLDAVFKRFVQADSSITHKFGGTGLGLSISKALAESMGGSIVVTSAVGKGSTFVLHLQLPAKSL